jgi:hypothetical protein
MGSISADPESAADVVANEIEESYGIVDSLSTDNS